MTARTWSSLMASIAVLAAGGTAARADDALSAALRGVVEANLAAYDRKDADATLQTIDRDSPGYQDTQQALAGLQDLRVDSQLVEFRYIGHDDEFAVARVKTRTTAEPGQSDFVDNTVDSIMIFHQEDGRWKLWSEEVLGVDIAPK